MILSDKLNFTAQKDSVIFFDVSENGGQVNLITSRKIGISFTNCSGVRLCSGNSCKFTSEGVYRALLTGDNDGDCVIGIEYSDNVTPFIMPSVGVMWNHGGIFPLLLMKNEPHTLWNVNDETNSYQVACIKRSSPYNEKAVFTGCDGQVMPLEWYPKLGRNWFWFSAELNSVGKYTKVYIPSDDSYIRYTVWNCDVVSLAEPEHDFSLGRLSLSAVDSDGSPIDVRYEIFVNDERVVMRDVLIGEETFIMLPIGKYTVKASHGIKFDMSSKTVTIAKNTTVSAKFTLNQILDIPKGWALGELHTHSAYEDATVFPKQVMRAARANGRSFCFMTDKSVDDMMSHGIDHADLEGNFIGIPGQEIMCNELHMNVLNTDHRFENPEADNLSEIHTDITDRIQKWITEYKEMKKRRPCIIVHNHPAHKPQSATMPYFRSWWVSDRFRDFTLVENYDYENWFERLNHGYRLFGAWTGDGHDCSLMYPGKEGVCVYVGDTLTAESVINALENGRFISGRAPGAFLNINVGDTAIGGTCTISGSNRLSVDIQASGTYPIDRIELIANGKIAEAFDPCGAYNVSMSMNVPDSAHWIIARMKLSGGEWNESTHSFTPLMCAGYDVFTNPIWIKRKP